jgi:hypothetical protein
MRKGSVEMIEYILTTLLIVAVIISIMIFLGWWNASQLRVEKSKTELDKTLVMTKTLISSPFFARGDSMLDDGKLTALQGMGDSGCDAISEIYGADWFAVARLNDGKGETKCNSSNYPDCNYWEFCMRSGANISYVVPVNIYRSFGTVMTTGIIGRTYVGTMVVGIYNAQ